MAGRHKGVLTTQVSTILSNYFCTYRDLYFVRDDQVAEIPGGLGFGINETPLGPRARCAHFRARSSCMRSVMLPLLGAAVRPTEHRALSGA